MDDYIRLINKIEDYIDAHLDERITLDDISKHANMSKYHFHRIFNHNSSETLNQFITRIKMERSAVFLTIRTDLCITEIAQSYGYSESSSYNRAFKKHLNLTPLEYRRARNVNQ